MMDILQSRVIFLSSVTGIILFFAAGVACAGSYTESAHGNSIEGVNRTCLSVFVTGNCAHCHEQHASHDGSEANPVSG